jgi:hypothetical protein
MKKKFRDIIVNDVAYTWACANNDKQEGGGEIKIWKNKRIIYKSYVDSDIKATPSYIAEIISVTEEFGDVSDK